MWTLMSSVLKKADKFNLSLSPQVGEATLKIMGNLIACVQLELTIKQQQNISNQNCEHI